MEEAGYKYALFGAGLSFNNGQPSEPTFGDVWKIDAGVCLANAATGLVCSGHGTPDLNALTCACDAAWQGDKLCSTCTPDGTRYGPDCLTCPAYNGSPCNAAAGGGVCDVARGCVCAAGYGPGTAACAPLPPPPPGYSPFTRLSINGLAGVMDPANGFGAEDKMVRVQSRDRGPLRRGEPPDVEFVTARHDLAVAAPPPTHLTRPPPPPPQVECNGAVVFIDLDANAGFRLRTLNGGRTWTSTPVMGGVCDNGSPPLYPRNNGYTVGVTKAIATGGDDRLVIIGGDTTENNVYISDDCGASWTCLDAAEVFGASEFRWMIDVPGVNIPYMPLIFGGGYVADDIVPGDITPSIGVFETFDGGVTWNRPQCTDQSNPGVTCTNPVPDEKRGGVAWAMSDIPTTSGMIARDSSTVWFFNPTADLDPGEVPVQYLNASNWRVGWQTVPGSTTANMFGRKAWLQGGSFKVGCWFSTDYDTDTMFVEKNREGAVNSMNQFSIAASAAGPWRVISSPAPWAPRAGAVLLPMEEAGYRYALFGAGMDFGLDVPGAPLFGDVWRIDAGVCMMDDAGVVCSGHGAPDLDTLAACLCDAGWGGDARCASCTPGTTYGPDCKLCQTTEDGSVCNAARGGGRCDSTAGCVCNPGFGPASTGCASPLTPAAATPAAAGPSPGAIAGGVLGALAAVGAAFAVVRVYGADAVGRAVARGASAAYSAVGSAAAAAAAAVAPAGERASERASLIGAGSAPSFSAAAASSASYGSSSASSASAKSSSSSASSPTTASAKAARVMSSEAAAARFGSLAKPGGAPAGAYNSDSA